MLGQYGALPLIAMFQVLWNTSTSITVKAAWNCTVTNPSAGVLVVTLNSLPATVPGATAANTTGVSDSTILSKQTHTNQSGFTTAILYGPNPSAPALNANQIQFTLTVGTFTGMLHGAAFFLCQDGSFTPETP